MYALGTDTRLTVDRIERLQCNEMANVIVGPRLQLHVPIFHLMDIVGILYGAPIDVVPLITGGALSDLCIQTIVGMLLEYNDCTFS